MDSSLKEWFARLAQIQALELVQSGSSAVLALRPARSLAEVQSIVAIKALVRRGVGLLKAKRAIEDCLVAGRALVHVPKVEDKAILASELAESGLAATLVASTQTDVRAIRERLGMTQEQFALRFGLELNSLQNWEAGRRRPDAAVRSYLKVIDRLPEAIGTALEDDLSPA